ncbi:CCA tRNA nucleotidyltransferase [Patescibacteria group bacterium]|nr:CCA tRNA nucleotidyltransferase [Patescibacteria group bacterium]
MKPTSIQIIEILKKAGHIAYWAGGCVRDMLLGIEPQDFDIATSAKPDEIEDLLEETIPVGKQFGVIIAVQNRHHFEIATFRSDIEHKDGRRPSKIEFTNAKEDALRRDFTINGIFYDPTEDKVIDYVGGEKDLEARLIRFIGDPHERILEDHLRILRAVRFKNQFNFQYDQETYKALEKHAKLANKVSNERIRDELNKILLNPNTTCALEELSDLELLHEILPELQELKGCPQPVEFHTEGDVWDHTMAVFGALKPDASLILRWAALLHDIGKPSTIKLTERIRYDGHCEKGAEIARGILGRLRLPKKDVDEICWLISHHMMVVPLFEMGTGTRRKWFLGSRFPHLLELFRVDAAGIEPVDLGMYDRLLELYKHDLTHMPHAPKPLLTGLNVMKELGIKPGPAVGEILDELYERQLAGEIRDRKAALKWLRKRN